MEGSKSTDHKKEKKKHKSSSKQDPLTNPLPESNNNTNSNNKRCVNIIGVQDIHSSESKENSTNISISTKQNKGRVLYIHNNNGNKIRINECCMNILYEYCLYICMNGY